MLRNRLARPLFEAGVVESLVIEVPVHAVEPWRDPAAAGFEKPDAQFRMPLDDAAPDHRKTGEHPLHRVGDDVPRAAPLEAVDADLRHAAAGAFVKPDRKIEIL